MGEKETEGFTSYLESVLQNSMLTGIPQIVTATSAHLKVLRALVFVSCVTGFIYQSMEFMNMYWEYQTIQDIQVEYPKTAEMPSITVCTNNGIDTTKVCSDPKFRSKCYPLKSFFKKNPCNCKPHFCDDGQLLNTTVPIQSVVDELSHSEYEIYQPYLNDITELIWMCHLDFLDLKGTRQKLCIRNYRNIRCTKADPMHILRACYTLHTLLDQPDEQEQQVSTQDNEVFMFTDASAQKNIIIADPQVQISIHNSRNILNPYVHGYHLEKGKIHNFRFAKTVKRLLPPPYETKCKDYLAEWKNRGGRGPTTEKECIEECQKNSSIKIHGCVNRKLLACTNERICKDQEIDNRVLLESQDCAAMNCKPACYEVSYEIEKEIVNFDSNTPCWRKDWSTFHGKLARVIINLDGMQTTTYTYSSKFENIEIFSYLGGYVGMWLGISLIAVFDFLESLLLILKYPFRQIMHQRARKTTLRRI